MTVLYYHCHSYFPCCELGHCRYHSQNTEYSEGDESFIVGVYPCCQQKVLRYDSLGVLSVSQINMTRTLTFPYTVVIVLCYDITVPYYYTIACNIVYCAAHYCILYYIDYIKTL